CWILGGDFCRAHGLRRLVWPSARRSTRVRRTHVETVANGGARRGSVADFHPGRAISDEVHNSRLDLFDHDRRLRRNNGCALETNHRRAARYAVMSPPIALHDPAFRAYFPIVLAPAVVGGAML